MSTGERQNLYDANGRAKERPRRATETVLPSDLGGRFSLMRIMEVEASRVAVQEGENV